MWEFVKSLLQSKKFVVSLVAVLAWILGRVGFDVAEADLLPLVGALVAFVLAQGVADHGKERAKVDGATALALQAQSGLQAAPTKPDVPIPLAVPPQP